MRRLLRLTVSTVQLALFLPARLLGSRATIVLAFALIGMSFGNGGLPGRAALTWLVATWAGWVVVRMLSIWLRPAWLGGRRTTRTRTAARTSVVIVARSADAPNERLFTGRLPLALRRLLDPPERGVPEHEGKIDDEAALQAAPG